MIAVNRIIRGECPDALKEIPNDVIDLIITSPPYANKRRGNYKGVSSNRYVGWFLPITEELYRILKPTGSFILNIKENCRSGERETYVLELILALKKLPPVEINLEPFVAKIYSANPSSSLKSSLLNEIYFNK